MRLIQVKDAAERLGVSRQTLENWGKAGVVRIRTIAGNGKAHWIDADTLDRLGDSVADAVKAQQAVDELTETLEEQEHYLLRLVEETRRDIIFARKAGRHMYAIDFYAAIPDMLSSIGLLNEREGGVIKRVVLGDSFSGISEDLGITRERIRQIFYKAIRKARDLSDLRERIALTGQERSELEFWRKEVNEYKSRIKELEEKLYPEGCSKQEDEVSLLSRRLVDCDLSVRALNCLKAADLETVGDLIKVRRESLLAFRNFGKKSLSEIEDFLKSIGKTFGTKYVVPVIWNPSGSHPWIRRYALSDTPDEIYEQ